MNLKLISLLIILDIASKQLAIWYLSFDPFGKVVLPFFNLKLAKNTGVSFSMFDMGTGIQRWVLIFFTSVFTLVLIYWAKTNKSKIMALGLSFIISGAIANIIDRIFSKAVVDFLQFHYGQYYFPTFNLADIFIFIGAVIILFEDMIAKRVK